MNCFAHGGKAAVGMCTVCQKGLCRECVYRQAPRLLCRDCATGASVAAYPWWGWYGYSYEYRSPLTIAGWPLLHLAAGVDPLTMRPRIARGVVAIGNIAVGALAVGGVACGFFTVGGASFGLLLAIGGVALGVGVSVGGFAIGSIAIGGAAVGFLYAIGGGAVGPAILDSRHCDEAARAFANRWLGLRMPGC